MNLDVSIVNKGENSAFLLGGEIVDRPLPRGSFMDQGENSRAIVESAFHFAYVRMHFRGSWSFCMLLCIGALSLLPLS